MSIDVSVVIPVYNEHECLPALVERCVAVGNGLGRPWELVLVDDGSHDDSAALITQAVQAHPDHVVGILLNRNYGQHAALMTGFEHARGAIVVTLDADLQNPPEEIPRLVAKIDEGVDVVGTVRRDRRDPLARRLASSLVNATVRRSTGVLMHDYGCMLRAYRRPIVEAMLQCPERSTFIPVLANAFARHTAEIDVDHAEREAGESRYGVWKLVNLQFDLLTSMTTFPLRLLNIGGLLIATAGVAFALLLLFLRLVHGPEWAAEGVFTLFAILFVFIGAQFMGMGMLGEYLGRVYHEVRARPRSFVSEVLRGAGQADARSPAEPGNPAVVQTWSQASTRAECRS